MDAFIAKLDLTGTTLLFSTYFGGQSIDEGVAITTDAAGGVYVTGLTSSSDLPIMPVNAFQTTIGGQFDAFITKLSGSGGVYANTYTTYLGGTNVDYGLSIAVDSALDACDHGLLRYRRNFYTAAPLQLPPGANVFYPDGHAFTNLDTQTKVLKEKSAALKGDGFVAELNPSGTLVPFSSYLGGSNEDAGQQITIDAADNVFVAGYTFSENFPTNFLTATPVPAATNDIIVFTSPGTNFLSHVFVVKIVNGALDHSVAYGGNLADQGRAIAVDGSGLVYVTGTVGSTNFFQRPLLVTNLTTQIKHGETVTNYFGIVTNSPVFTDLSNTNVVGLKHAGNTNNVFITVLSPDLSTFVSTIAFGGAGRDEATGIAVAPDGHAVYLVGTTTSNTNFVTPNAAQPLYNSNGKKNRLSDAFVGKIEMAPAP